MKPSHTSCSQCGSTVTQKGTKGSIKKYCSATCKTKARYIRESSLPHCVSCGSVKKLGRYCKPCRNKQDEPKNRERRFTRHGISVFHVAATHVCPICQDPAPEKTAKIDHDHSHCPGKRGCALCVRGLVCNRCNALLGLAHDKTEILLAAVDYLLYYREVLKQRLAATSAS